MKTVGSVTLSLGPPLGDRTAVLHCPVCKNDYMHQHRTEIFECGEDAAETLTVVEHGKTTVHGFAGARSGRNPSPRRHGLRVFFWCEHCTTANPEGKIKPVSLAVYQHKGMTYVEWENKT
jgi:hypothetical protein